MGSGARAFRFVKSRFRELGVRTRRKELLRGGRPRSLGSAEPDSSECLEWCAPKPVGGESPGSPLFWTSPSAPARGRGGTLSEIGGSIRGERSLASGSGLSSRGENSRFRDGIPDSRFGSLAARRSPVSEFLGRAVRALPVRGSLAFSNRNFTLRWRLCASGSRPTESRLARKISLEEMSVSWRFTRSAFRCSELPALGIDVSSSIWKLPFLELKTRARTALPGSGSSICGEGFQVVERFLAFGNSGASGIAACSSLLGRNSKFSVREPRGAAIGNSLPGFWPCRTVL